METNVEVYYRKEKQKDCSCLWIIAAVVAIVLAFFAGVLVTALTEIATTLSVGAIIVLLIALTVLLIIAVINIICCRKDDKKRKNYCCCHE